MANFTFTGGDKLKEVLANLSKKVNENKLLKVGFFEGSTETKGGVSTPYVAYCNEFGGTIPERDVPEHTTKIYRRVDKSGDFLNGAKFVKRGQSNFESEHVVPAHTIPEHTIPPRPFFRRMIAQGEKHWGGDLGAHLKQYGMDIDKSLSALGSQMTDELQRSIGDGDYAPLAKSTIQKKGNDQPLIDSGDMQNAVAFQVGEE